MENKRNELSFRYRKIQATEKVKKNWLLAVSQANNSAPARFTQEKKAKRERYCKSDWFFVVARLFLVASWWCCLCQRARYNFVSSKHTNS